MASSANDVLSNKTENTGKFKSIIVSALFQLPLHSTTHEMKCNCSLKEMTSFSGKKKV